MENVKGVIFDFNGVLFWDSHLHEKAWKIFSKQIRGSEFSAEEMHEFVHGRTNKDTLEYLTKREISGTELDDLTQGKETIYRRICLELGDEFKLAPGAEEFLNFLVRRNIPRTIATASEITNLKFFFENLILDKWFDITLTVYDDGSIKGKPAPDIYIKAAAKLNLAVSDCMVIEDSSSGIASANSAGIGTIVALGPKEKHNYLSGLNGVARTIVDFNDLYKLMKTQYE